MPGFAEQGSNRPARARNKPWRRVSQMWRNRKFWQGGGGWLPKRLIACIDPPRWGHVAEWLRNGLQMRAGVLRQQPSNPAKIDSSAASPLRNIRSRSHTTRVTDAFDDPVANGPVDRCVTTRKDAAH
jgi:hypothetical protein